MWCEVWFMVSGEHVYCAMRSNMDGHYTWKLHLAYTALSLCGELYRRRQRLCSERERASSQYWLYPVATFEFRLWWLLLKSYRFQGRVETHIIWGRTNACNGKLLWYYIWNVCALGNCNLQQQRYVGLMTSGISRNVFRWTGQRPLGWRDRMRSGDGRRCSVFVSVCLSQDGRNNHMLCLSQYVYLRIDSVT